MCRGSAFGGFRHGGAARKDDGAIGEPGRCAARGQFIRESPRRGYGEPELRHKGMR